MKRILIAAIAATTFTAGIGAADAAQFFYRYRGTGPQYVAAVPSLPADLPDDVFRQRFMDYFGMPYADWSGEVSASVVQDFLWFALSGLDAMYPGTDAAFTARFGMPWDTPEAGNIPLSDLIAFFKRQPA